MLHHYIPVLANPCKKNKKNQIPFFHAYISFKKGGAFMKFDPKYDPEHYNWDSSKNQNLDPLYEHLQYYTPFGQQWMSNIEDILNAEPTLNRMQGMIHAIDQYLDQESKNLKWWTELADRYFQRDELEHQRTQAKAYEKVKLTIEINKINREIKRDSKGYSEERFRKNFDYIVEKHQQILMDAEDMRVRMSVGIDLWKHASVREIYHKYPDLNQTIAGRDIAPFLKQVNEELGRDLKREEIIHRYETRPNPEIKKLRDAFLAADKEKLAQAQDVTKQSSNLDEKQNLSQKQEQTNQQKPGRGQSR
jgi:hypothetical protein